MLKLRSTQIYHNFKIWRILLKLFMEPLAFRQIFIYRVLQMIDILNYWRQLKVLMKLLHCFILKYMIISIFFLVYLTFFPFKNKYLNPSILLTFTVQFLTLIQYTPLVIKISSWFPVFQFAAFCNKVWKEIA